MDTIACFAAIDYVISSIINTTSLGCIKVSIETMSKYEDQDWKELPKEVKAAGE